MKKLQLVITLVVAAAGNLAAQTGSGPDTGSAKGNVVALLKGQPSAEFQTNGNGAELQEVQGNILLRFQLMEASSVARNQRDPAIAAIDSVLRDLFRYSDYRLISQAAVVAATNASTSLILSDGAAEYQLDVSVTLPAGSGAFAASSTPVLQIELRSVLKQSASAIAQGGGQFPPPATSAALRERILLRTTITLSFGQTVVLGSTQPGGSGTALILAVRPERLNN